MVDAAEAKAFGVVSEIYDGELEARSVEFIREKLSATGSHPAVRDLDVPDPRDAAWFGEKRKALAKRARGQLSPLRCADALQATCEMDFEAGLAREREIFAECIDSPQREGLIHYFFAERQATNFRSVSRRGWRPRDSRTGGA